MGLTWCLPAAVSCHPIAQLASSVSAWVPFCVAGSGESQGSRPHAALARGAVSYMGGGGFLSKTVEDLELKGAIPGLKVLLSGQPAKEQMMQTDEEENK